jgi:phenylacetyl-CoA:acceptor oxidoreductase subunit 1
MDEKNTVNRRDVLKLALAGGAAVAAWQALPAPEHSANEPAGEHRWAMVIDLDKCIGCGYCTLACQANNDTPPDIRWNRVLETREIAGKTHFLPVPCQHCEHAACVEACPVKATYHRPDGIVMMDYDRCIGCRYCEVACPYGARSFNWQAFTGDNPAVPEWGSPQIPRRPRGVAEKCSFCYQRIDRGLAAGLVPGIDPEATPACVDACPVGARVFGDLNDPNSNVNRLLAENHYGRLREDLGTGPRVYYLNNEAEVLG